MIIVDSLTKVYKTGQEHIQALKGVSLNIEDGEFISVIGPSGSGKTTLLNLIGCIDTLDEGTITIDSVTVSKLNDKEQSDYRRHHLGFVFQTYNLIPVFSAFENVAFALHILHVDKKEIVKRTNQILEEVGLKGLEDRRPNTLSGGQQQRISIARALVKKPTLVLADEPTANLDSHTATEIMELMKRMNEHYGTTFIFSTHDPLVMEYANRIVPLHDGLIVDQGVL
ncbi:MAG: ABC transporter ATP-binding protein [Sphaerochaetaceae bacterium]|jgi:putative ABC transport system ATP-binding protein